MEEERRSKALPIDALDEALKEAGWDWHEQTNDNAARRFEMVMSHQSLPKEVMRVLFEASAGPSQKGSPRIEQKLLHQSAAASIDCVLGLEVKIWGLDTMSVASGNLQWSLYHRDLLPAGPTRFSAPVSELADRISFALVDFEKQVMERGRASKRKKAPPKARKSVKGSKKEALEDQIDTEVSGAAERTSLPFELIPGADPNNSDIVFVSIGDEAGPGKLNKDVLSQIGSLDIWPSSEDLSKGFHVMQRSGRPGIVVFVVTVERMKKNESSTLLRWNLEEALSHLAETFLEQHDIIWLPLMGTGTGGLSFEESLILTSAGAGAGLKDFGDSLESIIIAPPMDTNAQVLKRLENIFPSVANLKVEYDDLLGSPIDASGDVGLSDAASSDPKLGFPDIAQSFLQFIDEMVADRPVDNDKGALITIGLFGRWGTGKSTMIDALWKAFENRYTQIMVNAWKWDGDEDIHDFFHDTFIQELRSKRFNLYWSYLWRREARSVLRALVALVVVGAFAGVAYAFFSFAVGQEWISVIPAGPDDVIKVGVSSIAVLMLGLAYYDFVFKPVRARFASVVESWLLPEDARNLGREGLARTYQTIAALRALKSGSKGKEPSLPFIFYIDDLDRCTPERVATFVQSVHSLTAAGCVTFVACDEAYVSSALQSHFEDVAKYHPEKDDFGRNFLNKIIQLPFRVPAVDNEGLAELGHMRKRYTKLIRRAEPSEAAEDEGGAGLSRARGTMKVSSTDPSLKVGLGEEKSWPARLLPLLPEHYRDGIWVRSEKFFQELGLTSEKDRETIYAFCFADLYIPDWLDEFQRDEVDTILADALTDLTPEAGDAVANALREGQEVLRRLVEHRLVRISEVLDKVLEPLTEPLRLTLRDIKSLTNQLWIHLRIESFEEIDDAKIAAAYLLADRLDPLWLDQHLGLPTLNDKNELGRINRTDTKTQNALKKMIDKKKVEELRLRRWRASA